MNNKIKEMKRVDYGFRKFKKRITLMSKTLTN
ncbi:hypothetical protein KIJ04_02480 [Leuconostoc gelidum subsp. gelidum]|nr:hypothetical protein [Leuconostoc gelidum subsp. gelidum]